MNYTYVVVSNSETNQGSVEYVGSKPDLALEIAEVASANGKIKVRVELWSNGYFLRDIIPTPSKDAEEKLNEAYKRIEQLEKDLYKSREETADIVISTYHKTIAKEKKKAIEAMHRALKNENYAK